MLERAKDEHFRLKLGMGKPHGMGAVAIASSLHLDDRPARYSRLFVASGGGWSEHERDPGQTWSNAVEQFERFVLDGIGERSPKYLADLPRIRALLAMLSWPGPELSQTRYLEIEHQDPTAKRGKVNEYKERPVLPDPLAVLGDKKLAATIQSIQSRSPQQKIPEPSRFVDGQLPPGYYRGKVECFGLGPNKSFGFITTLPGKPKIFVHRNRLAPDVNTLKAGQLVIFRLIKGMKTEEADDVRPVE